MVVADGLAPICKDLWNHDDDIHATCPISGILTSGPSHTTMAFEVMDGAKATALIFAE